MEELKEKWKEHLNCSFVEMSREVFKAAVICRIHPKKTCPGLAMLTLQK